MTTLVGRGVSAGVAIGRISFYTRKGRGMAKRQGGDVALELDRFAGARESAERQLREIHDRALGSLGAETAAIFEIHAMMLDDRDFLDAVEGQIRLHARSAEEAIEQTVDQLAALFEAMEDGYMRARAADIRDVGDRLLASLSGETGAEATGEPCILCADDLSPSETVMLDTAGVLAFVTASGSQSSHTAILAAALGIPAVVGVGDALFASATEGMLAVVDGESGRITLSPDDALLRRAEQRQMQDRKRLEQLERLRGERSVTRDGVSIGIYANVGGADGAALALRHDAEGIGLFRSELLYLGRDEMPSEQEQYLVYRRLLKEMGDRRTVVRTLDVGADKQIEYLGLGREENPALGLRAVRYCLRHPEILVTQLRALYRASLYGRLAILFPMITSEWELARLLMICREVREGLDAEGIGYAEGVELGIMIETPAAALISDRLAPMVDFFSVGTNDLIQYTLACDRGNREVLEFCDPHHEAVLRLIERSAESAHAVGKWIGICGELAADLSLTETFLRMGIDELSVSPRAVLPLREKVRSLDLSEKA